MPDGWQWDPTLFRGAAVYYDQGRLPYAPGYPAELARVLALEGQGRLLDVGCGPGRVSLALARYFAEVVGVDPDPDMLAEAQQHAHRLGVQNARWVQARAEDLPAGLGSFSVLLFAQSFHWVDREQVAATAFRMLRPGGHFVHLSGLEEQRADPVSLPHPAPPFEFMAQLVRQYLGEARRAGQGTLPRGTPSGEREIVERAGFEGYERLLVPSGSVIERSTDDVVASLFARSDSAPHLYGEQVGQFERDLRSLLHKVSPQGVFAERLPDTMIWIWHKPGP